MTEGKKAAVKTEMKTAPKAENRKEKKESAGWLSVAGVLVAVVAVGIIIVMLNTGSVAKAVAERIASQALGVPVTIGAMDINIEKKTVTVTGLRVGNPPGFRNPYALTLQTLAVEAESLSPQKMVFNQIRSLGAVINLEVTGTDTNLTALRARAVERAAQQQNGETSSGVTPKVIIKDLLITDTTLNPAVTLAGGVLAPVKIANLDLTGIGEKENGVSVAQAMTMILGQVSKASLQAAGTAGFLQGMPDQALQSLKSQYGFDSTFLDRAKENFNSLIGGVKGMFGKK